MCINKVQHMNNGKGKNLYTVIHRERGVINIPLVLVLMLTQD